MNNELEMTLFEPAVILPTQMSGGARGNGDTSGACALMFAILEDAILCIERGRRGRRHAARAQAAEAETWIRSDCRWWLFSFASICDVLGFDADALRVRLVTNAERPASGGPEPDAQATQLSAPGAAGARLLLQREGTRGSIAVDSARAPARLHDWQPGNRSRFRCPRANEGCMKEPKAPRHTPDIPSPKRSQGSDDLTLAVRLSGRTTPCSSPAGA